MSETHSCVSYISILLKTIVGETAYKRATNALADQKTFKFARKSKSQEEEPPKLGTLEEYF